MKRCFQNKFGRSLWRLGCFVTLSLIWPAEARLESLLQDGEKLPPPKPTLVAIHWPDLSQLESDVRNQILSQQRSLTATVKSPNTSEAQLTAAYGALGEVYHAYSITAPARECYLNANHLSPSDFRWIYLLGKLDQLEGRSDNAIRRFQNVSALKPELNFVHVNLGKIYLELNRLDDAVKSFSAALGIDRQNPAALYGLGQVALSRRDYAQAVVHFEKALTLAPEANRIHYALAMAYRGLQNQEKARIHLAQQGPVGVRVADPLMDRLQELVQGVRMHLIRGKQALEAKRYAEAVVELRKAVATSPDSVPAHVNLGAALTQLGDLKGAAEEFETTLRIDPNNTNAHYNLAVLYANEGDHQKAIAHLKTVSTLNPSDVGARFLLATQLLKIDRPEEALQIAQSLYESTKSLQHGALVVLGLAALDRCNEAADWQRRLIAAAEQQGNFELVARFKADLQRYEKGQSCRPDW